MENRAFLQDFTNKAVSHRRAALESCRRPHDDVQWKTDANAAPADPSSQSANWLKREKLLPLKKIEPLI